MDPLTVSDEVVMTWHGATPSMRGSPLQHHDYVRELLWSGRIVAVLHNALRVKWYHVAPKARPAGTGL